jgi:hypothetical protein
MNPTVSGDQAFPAVGLRHLSLAGYARPRYAPYQKARKIDHVERQ